MIRFATVHQVTSTGVKVIFNGETVASTKAYKKLASYNNPVMGDKVALIQISGTYFILGKII